MKNKDLFILLQTTSNIVLMPPVSFFDIIQLERNAKMIITDSGGVQKEAYFFKKPCIILRPDTEWVVLVETEAATIADANYDEILAAYKYYNNNRELKYPEIFGDGHAAEFICETILANNIC